MEKLKKNMNKDVRQIAQDFPSWNELKLEKIKHLLILNANRITLINQGKINGKIKDDLVEAISIVDGILQCR
jgi:hypothetical protein